MTTWTWRVCLDDGLEHLYPTHPTSPVFPAQCGREDLADRVRHGTGTSRCYLCQATEDPSWPVRIK